VTTRSSSTPRSSQHRRSTARAGGGSASLAPTTARTAPSTASATTATKTSQPSRSPRRPAQPRCGSSNGNQGNATERAPDEPASTVAFGHNAARIEWVNGTHEKAARRDADEPAPTVHFGERQNTVEWEVSDTGETRGEGEVKTDGRKRKATEPAPSMTSRADQLERREMPPACGCDWGYIDADGFCACCEAHLDDPDGLYALQGDPTVHRYEDCPRRSALADGPAPTITTTRKSDKGMLVGRQLPDGEGRNVGGHGWTDERPATTVAGDPRVHPPGHKVNADDLERGHDHYEERRGANAVRVSLEEAAILQGFPPGYPFQGSRTKQFEQVGNAVPPPLAAAILSALLEADPELAEREVVAP
jgi:site-specific DNA-cytosine methylase